jgi:putative endonuclease
MGPKPDGRRELGHRGEEEAVRYLAAKGYRILDRGFRMFGGEIDIIARQGQTLVFVEVKTRRRTDFGLPDESVNLSKQNQVRKIALGYLLKKHLPEDRTSCRFDVLSIVWAEGQGSVITHLEDAF